MLKKWIVRICTISLVVLALPLMVLAETVGLFFDSNVAQIKFAADVVKIAFESKGFTVEMFPLTSLSLDYFKKM